VGRKTFTVTSCSGTCPGNTSCQVSDVVLGTASLVCEQITTVVSLCARVLPAWPCLYVHFLDNIATHVGTGIPSEVDYSLDKIEKRMVVDPCEQYDKAFDVPYKRGKVRISRVSR
jgi:hypothetical protein